MDEKSPFIAEKWNKTAIRSFVYNNMDNEDSGGMYNYIAVQLKVSDPLIPIQQHVYPHLTPIQTLTIAMLQNAVTGLRGMSVIADHGKRSKQNSRLRRRKTHAEEDRDWFLSDGDDPGQFVWCCEILGVSPGYLRRLVLPLYMTGQAKSVI